MVTKKYLIVLILRLLESESDAEHPMTQVEIADAISRAYPCDRKTVGRNIKFLCEVGYPIVKTPKGFYMDRRLFTRDEVGLILRAVRGLSAEGIDTEELCERLEAGLTRYYKAN